MFGQMSRIAAATCAAFVGLGMGAAASLAAPSSDEPTVDNPGGIESPNSPPGGSGQWLR